jgi:hypothetical protein
MGVTYRTVYEISYFSNGLLQTPLLFLAGGIAASATGLVLWRLRKLGRWQAVAFGLFCAVWVLAYLASVWAILGEGWRQTSALRDGQCEITEGTVHVLFQQPKGGHTGGDRVRVGEREFEINRFDHTLAYRQTIAHGGVLVEGAVVRLHHQDGEILKVEVADGEVRVFQQGGGCGSVQ